MFDDRRRAGNPGAFTGCGIAGDNQQHFPREAPDGRTVSIGLSSPTSLLGGGFFKIKSGKIHRIHTILTTAPYGMKSGW
jgi:hypothetical protein